MKTIKYLILLCLVCFPFSVSAQQYDITNYYIDVVVNENNIYDISEYYNVMFNESSNFTRNFSLRPEVHLSNGKFITYITKVNDFTTNEKYNDEIDSKSYKVKFLSSYANTSRTIALSYKYDMGHDLDSKNDIIFVNIVDGTFTPLNKETSFAITVPKEVDDNAISFYLNGKRMDTSDKVEYEVYDNYIQGTIKHNIKKNDVISIQVVLPNGTFSGTHSTENAANYLLLVLPFITLIISIVLIKKYKREKHKVIENPFEITNTFDSLELSYLHKGSINTNDLISLVFKLANDGYISLKNYGDKDNISFQITKVKEYDKNNAAEKIIFDGLFQNKDEIDVRDIEGIFYPYYIDARRTLENHKNTNKMFYRFITKFKVGLLILSYLCLFSLQIAPLYNLLDSYVFAIVLSLVLSVICVLSFQFKNKILKYIVKLISIGILIINIYALLDFRASLVIYICGALLTITTLYIESIMPIRTPYGNQMHYEVDSLKLELAGMTDETFDMKTEANSNYFFEMIPYTIIFDLTGWWFNRFSSKVSSQPSWYDSSDVYTHEKFLEFIQMSLVELSIIIQTNKMYRDELLHQAPNKLL